ncbi:hypothetical protein HN51_015614, partial [Arachis hypogaea]
MKHQPNNPFSFPLGLNHYPLTHLYFIINLIHLSSSLPPPSQSLPTSPTSQSSIISPTPSSTIPPTICHSLHQRHPPTVSLTTSEALLSLLQLHHIQLI